MNSVDRFNNDIASCDVITKMMNLNVDEFGVRPKFMYFGHF